MDDKDLEKKKRKVKWLIRLAYATIAVVIIVTILQVTCVIPSWKYGAFCNKSDILIVERYDDK